MTQTIGFKVNILYHSSLPALTYHSVTSCEKINTDLLEIHFRVLSKSGLPSLLPKHVKTASKGFLLTFDDGFADVWTHVLPLLKIYGLKAVVFIIPSRCDNGPPRKLGNRAYHGNPAQAHMETATNPGPHPAFLRWSELEAMEMSGHVEVQSHSFSHRMGWTGNDIIDFHLPPVTDTHWSLVQASGGDVRAGIPIFQRGSALGHKLYFDDPSLRDYLADWLEKKGGKTYIVNKGPAVVRKELFKIAGSYSLDHSCPGKWESEAQRKNRTLEDIVKARSILEKRLGGIRDELCLPWGEYDSITIECAKKAGIQRIYTLDRGANPTGRIGFLIKRFEPRPRGALWLRTRIWIYRSRFRAELYKRLSRR